MSREDVHAKVVATRARQGLPPTIQDPGTLERVAAILRLVDDESSPPRLPIPRRLRTTGETTSA